MSIYYLAEASQTGNTGSPRDRDPSADNHRGRGVARTLRPALMDPSGDVLPAGETQRPQESDFQRPEVRHHTRGRTSKSTRPMKGRKGGDA